MTISAEVATDRTFEQKLDLLAGVAVKSVSASRPARTRHDRLARRAALARRITEQAYRAGASQVTTSTPTTKPR